MLGPLGDSVFFGACLVVLLFVFMGVWYTVGVRLLHRLQDSFRKAEDELSKDERYNSPSPSETWEEKLARYQREGTKRGKLK